MKLSIVLMLVVMLAACDGGERFQPGDEDQAISMCGPNGGVAFIDIITRQDGLEGSYHTEVVAYCNNGVRGSYKLIRKMISPPERYNPDVNDIK